MISSLRATAIPYDVGPVEIDASVRLAREFYFGFAAANPQVPGAEQWHEIRNAVSVRIIDSIVPGRGPAGFETNRLQVRLQGIKVII